MPISPSFNSQIKANFERIIHQIDNIPKKQQTKYVPDWSGREERPFIVTEIDSEHFQSIKIQVLSLVNMFGSSEDEHLVNIYREIQVLGPDIDNLKSIRGIIQGLKLSYEAGMLDGIVKRLEANIAADYLGQAEELLNEGQPGKYDHVPAAVLTGAILENALRTLCNRQTPPIPISKPNGEPKTLNGLIDDLKKENVFNELKAKQLRAWADIRNAAAHGEFGKFNRQDVEQMLAGVQTFLADYL